MDEAQSGFGALCQVGSLPEDDAVLLKSPKVEILDEQDDDEEILAMLKEEEMIIEQDFSFSLTNSGSTADTMCNENMYTNNKTLEWVKSETSEEAPDLASGQTVDLLKTPGGYLHEDPTSFCRFEATIEKVEAIDSDQEELEELDSVAPWHIKFWPAEGEVDRAEVGGDEQEAGLGEAVPSTSETAVMQKNKRPSSTRKSARLRQRNISEDSDLDSECDYEFDVSPIETSAFTSRPRDIPIDDELEEPVRHIVRAMESVMDNAADCLPGISTQYKWVEDFETFRGVPEQFSGPTPGPPKDYDKPYDAFVDIWSNDIIGLIVEETNRYARQTIDVMKAEGTLKTSSRLHQWTDTDADEIMVFFSVLMFMAIDLRTNQYEYWKSGTVLEMPKFRNLMPYNRYLLLNKFLHFVDNSDVNQNRQQSEGMSLKLAKLAPVISHLNLKFSSLYHLQREISIDESLILNKGRLSWVDAIRSKAARINIKSYELCESHTRYLYRFQIYTGKNRGSSANDVTPSVDLARKSTQVVLDLLKGLENLGHCVTMNNFFNCPALARYLKSLGFDCIGTLRTNRRNVPDAISKIPEDVAKGVIIARQCGDVSIVAWKDTELVTMISTYHDDDTYVGTKSGKVLTKPVVIKDYNNAMAGVDLIDQKLSMYMLGPKRGLKWYVKMFKRLMNISIHNAYVMYVSSLRRRGKRPMTDREFRYELAQSLVARHSQTDLPEIKPQLDRLLRLRKDVMHVPRLAASGERRRCVICHRLGKTKLARLQCVTCTEYMCFEDCWVEWHSLTNLKGQDIRSRKKRRTK